MQILFPRQYLLKDPKTGQILKVGQTQITTFIGRFEKYVTAGKKKGMNLIVEVFEVPKKLRGKIEGQIRKNFKGPLPWDNTNGRLGRGGSGIL